MMTKTQDYEDHEGDGEQLLATITKKTWWWQGPSDHQDQESDDKKLLVVAMEKPWQW
jgi:hypothetical protein